MNIKIDDNVPMPAGYYSIKYPWMEMEVGQSFLVPAETKLPAIRRLATMRRPDGRRFSVRKTPDGYRCWRIA
jgi:hypothetical protein